jgi:hypothetical protein
MVFSFLTKMVPSNFKQNVKENPNPGMGKTKAMKSGDIAG